MTERTMRQIEALLEIIDKRLVNAEEYLAQNVNVEGTSFLHFKDWEGKSGHPLWMRNHMIPTTARHRSKKEKALRKIADKVKDKDVSKFRRCASHNID